MKLERRSTYKVSGPLTPGGSVSYRNRRYRLLDILDHTTRHGRNTQLLKWEGDCIECPLHGAQFNIKTGKAETPPATVDLAIYEVKIEGDDIMVGLPNG